MSKRFDTLQKLITEIEDHRNDLQIEQDNSEEEMANFDPEEDDIEPEEINHQDEIDLLDKVLGHLQAALESLP